MQYSQSREQSAEFLRVAIKHMGRQQSAFHPASYTLWYEHAAGLNAPLSRVLEERMSASKPLTDADVSLLYAQHIASRDGQAIEAIRQRLMALLQETSEALSDTGSHALQFGQSLEGHTERLKRPDSANLIHAIVNDLLTETQQMSAVNQTLGRQLDARAQEVQTLTQRLERAEAAALNDLLTGLLNRRGFEQAAGDLCKQSGLLQGAALLVADVDEFKLINDTHGHVGGDQVLRGIAKVLRARIKGADIAARLGGDEFAILLPETSLSGAVALAEKLRIAVSQARLHRVGREEQLGNIAMSFGVAHCGTGASLEALLESADVALYVAKREGRNQVRAAGAEEAADQPVGLPRGAQP